MRLPIAILIGALCACSSPKADQRYVATALPDSSRFAPVSQLLDARCGTLDCHGTAYRNLRLYGSVGLRWSATDQPFVPLCNTPDEVAQDYQSVVGLEPEKTSAVVQGADPSVLTLVRKPRGTEDHKAGQIWTQRDDSDLCLTAWLTGLPDGGACSRALRSIVPNASTNPIVQCIP